MLFIIISALHVSGGFFAHHQELIKTVCAALGIVMHSCCLPLVWMGWNCSAANKMQLTQCFFIIISALHVSGGFFAHHQELIKLYVRLWVLSCFPAVYRWCGCVGTPTHPHQL